MGWKGGREEGRAITGQGPWGKDGLAWACQEWAGGLLQLGPGAPVGSPILEALAQVTLLGVGEEFISGQRQPACYSVVSVDSPLCAWHCAWHRVPLLCPKKGYQSNGEQSPHIHLEP